MDTNKVWLGGLAISQPILTTLYSGTKYTTFNLKINETYKDREGNLRSKGNIFKIESLGKHAEITASRVEEGCRYFVDGYLRQDVVGGVERIKIRTYTIFKDESHDKIIYNEGIKKALDIVVKSPNIHAAIEALEGLVFNKG